jgi:hypothetical protein
MLLASVVGAAAISLLVRSANAWVQREPRDERHIVAAARRSAAVGSIVCIEPAEFYFAGRSLRWRMYEVTDEGIKHCEQAIIQVHDTASDAQKRLEGSGFRRTAVLFEQGSGGGIYGWRGFGPYAVYRK